jgi:hypothetical protein
VEKWLLLWKANIIGPSSTDQHKQSLNMRIDFIKQNENFEKSQELEGHSEKKLKTHGCSLLEPRLIHHTHNIPTFLSDCPF